MSQNPQPPHVPYAGMYTPPPPKKQFGRGLFGWFIFIALCIVLFILMNKNEAAYTLLNLSDVTDQIEQGNAGRVVVAGDMLKVDLRRPVAFGGVAAPVQQIKAELPPGVTGSWAFTEWLLANRKGATVVAANGQNVLMSIIVPLIPWFLIFGFIWFFVFRQLRKQTVIQTPAGYVVAPPSDRSPPPGGPSA